MAVADLGTALVGAIGALIGGGLTATGNFLNVRVQQGEAAHLREEQRAEADRVWRRQVDERQREACVAFVTHVRTYMEHARALAEAIEEDDNENLRREAEQRSRDSWTDYCTGIAALRVFGPRQLAVPARELDQAVRAFGGQSGAFSRGEAAKGYSTARRRVGEAEEAFAAAAQAVFDTGLVAPPSDNKTAIPHSPPVS